MNCICNDMNLTLNSNGSPNIVESTFRRLPCCLRMDLLDALRQHGGIGKDVMVTMTAARGKPKRRHYLRTQQGQLGEHGEVDLQNSTRRAQCSLGTWLTLFLEQLCRSESFWHIELDLEYTMVSSITARLTGQVRLSTPRVPCVLPERRFSP